jgi:hypothetical protein
MTSSAPKRERAVAELAGVQLAQPVAGLEHHVGGVLGLRGDPVAHLRTSAAVQHIVATARPREWPGLLPLFEGQTRRPAPNNARVIPLPASLGAPAVLAQFADDELLRVPDLWARLLDSAASMPQRSPAPTASLLEAQAGHDEMLHLARVYWARMGTAFLDSLRSHLRSAEAPAAPAKPPARSKGGRLVLELVDDEVIALDIELSHTVQAVREAAEQELRDLQAYLAAMVGDMDVAADHNPFPPSAYGQALRAAAQVLPLALPQRLAFIRAVTPALAEGLRQAWASACARLAETGLEPATHRSVITQEDHRWRFMPAPVVMPDLLGMRDAMPHASGRFVAFAQAVGVVGPQGEPQAPGLTDIQSLELVHRLFKAMEHDERVPADVAALIEELREPAMRLTLRDPSVLDRAEHPLWRLIHLFAYQAEMVPRVHDDERRRWLEFGAVMFEDLALTPMQKNTTYRRAVEQLEEFLGRRLEQRVAALAKRLDALQRTEAGLSALSGEDTQSEGPELDTVPAALMPRAGPDEPGADEPRSGGSRSWCPANGCACCSTVPGSTPSSCGAATGGRSCCWATAPARPRGRCGAGCS